jgi:NO-binding membrane sensor protein with MHYT domain
MLYMGMAAFQLPVLVRYELPTVLVSMVAAILVSAVALFVVSRKTLTKTSTIRSSTVAKSILEILAMRRYALDSGACY